MCHQHIHAAGDEVPLVKTGLASGKVEGPCTELRLPAVQNTQFQSCVNLT